MNMSPKKSARIRRDIIKDLRKSADEPARQVELLKSKRTMVDPLLWEMVHEELDASSHPDVIGALRDGDALRGLHAQVLEEAGSHDAVLKRIGWEVLLTSFAAYMEAWYFEAPTDAMFESQRGNLVAVLQRVAEEKKKLSPYLWNGRRGAEKALSSIRSRVARGKALDAFTVFAAWDAVLEVETLIDDYCLKGWVVSDDGGLTIVPKDKRVWHNWVMSNHKFQVIDVFYQSLPMFCFRNEVAEIEAHVRNPETCQTHVSAKGGQLFLADMLGVSEVELDGVELDFHDVLTNMLLFDGCYKMQYVPALKAMKEEGWDYIQAIIETEEEQAARQIQACMEQGRNPLVLMHEGIDRMHVPCIFTRSRSEMLRMMTQYDTDPVDEAMERACLAALEMFSAEPHWKGVDNGQFIKTPEGNYIIMPRFFHGDAKTSLFNILVRKQTKNKIFSNHMERNIEWMFQEQGYATQWDWYYDVGGDIREGQVDVLAYKDGHLFVVEAKLTYFRNQIHSVYEHRDKLRHGGGATLPSRSRS